MDDQDSFGIIYSVRNFTASETLINRTANVSLIATLSLSKSI